MVLSAGARFGAYEVLELLGAGGMGEVYRARDTRLKREAFPSWSTARSELFFRNPNTQQIMVASFTAAGQSFRADKPRVWSPGLSLARPRLRPYALHPDGKRVALASRESSQATARTDRVVFVFNFFDELRRLAPVSK